MTRTTTRSRKPKNRDGFNIAIICALTLERDAVIEMFDEVWEATEYRKAAGDPNTYTVGRIGPHNVVVALLPGMGIQEAASTSASFKSSFRNITLGLVVGVCGGVATATDSGDILLGDVILSKDIIDVTFGRQYDNKFSVKDTLADRFGRPNREIRAFLGTLEGKQDRAKLKAKSSTYLMDLCQKAGFESSQFPGNDKDILYPRSYRHKHQQPSLCDECALCITEEDTLKEAEAAGKSEDEIKMMEANLEKAAVCVRSEKMSCEDLKCDKSSGTVRNCHGRAFIQNTTVREPEIHFGIIGSGNSVIKSGYHRDRLAEERQIIAFEMEGAGVWDNFPTVVIKGVCDYADSHKSKDWQNYSAASAAACMKAFLVEWPVTDDASSSTAEASRIPQRFPFPRNDDVVVREMIFSMLERLLPPQLLSQSAVLWGLGGAGKTQIALEFAYRRHLDQQYSVFWVHASSYDQFLHGYQQIAGDAGLSPTLQGPELLTAVCSWLESQTDWLLILDNADELSLFGLQNTVPAPDDGINLMSFIPRGSRGSILWTTRDERAVGNLVGVSRGINVQDMTNDEARELLIRLSGQAETLDDSVSVPEILSRLQRLPLAISQAAAFIRARNVPYRDYLNRLSHDHKRWRVLTEDGPNRHRPDGVPHNVMQTWQITVDHLEQAHPLAHWILSIMVYFHNQEIPWSLVKVVGLQWLQENRPQRRSTSHASRTAQPSDSEDSDVEEDEIRTALGRLIQFSLVRDRKQDLQCYDLHKLVQDATRRALRRGSKRNENSQTSATAEKALSILSRVFPSSEYGTWGECAKLLTHVLTIRQWPELADRKFKMCKLLSRASSYLYQQGRVDEAEEIDVEVLELRTKMLGEKHPDTIRSMIDLAATYHKQNRLEETEVLNIKVLDLRKETLGESDPETIGSMADLAMAYHQQRQFSKAEEIYVEVLKLQKEELGEKHPDIIKIMADLAATYHQQGRYDEAEKIKVEALALRKEVLGDTHPYTLWSMASLAKTYREQWRLSEAGDIFVEVLQLRKAVLGGTHPDTIKSTSDLAETYYQQEKWSQSEELYVEALRLRKEVMGEKHPDTIKIRNVLERSFPRTDTTKSNIKRKRKKVDSPH